MDRFGAKLLCEGFQIKIIPPIQVAVGQRRSAVNVIADIAVVEHKLFGDGVQSLDAGDLPTEVTQAFTNEGVTLTGNANVVVLDAGAVWRIRDGENEFTVKNESGGLNIYAAPLRLINSADPVTGDYVTDPLNPDTDADGLKDGEEVYGFELLKRNGEIVGHKQTNPSNFDSDADTAKDGIERRLGCDPRSASDKFQCADDDGDGLANIVEIEGWNVTYDRVSTNDQTPDDGAPVTIHVTSTLSIKAGVLRRRENRRPQLGRTAIPMNLSMVTAT